MTAAALGGGRDMVDDLGRCDTRVMAGRAIVGIDAKVVKGDARKADKVISDVTRRAVERRRYVITRLPEADFAVMARPAIIDIDAHMIKRRVIKVRGVVTCGAIRRGGQVINQLANGDHIVMT